MADWDGAGYAHISALQRTMAEYSLAAVSVRGDERVLDIGCGDGYVTRLIADRLPQGSVLGVDPSPRMIDTAVQANEQSNVTFRVGDVTTMTFAQEFDLAVSFNALHWVHEQETAYRNIADALVPGGRVLVQFVCAGDRPSVEQVAMYVTNDPRWIATFADFAPPFIHIQPDSLPAIAAEAGLVVTDSEVVDREWDFGSREAFAEWCTVGFADWTARLGPDVTDFVDAVVDRYEAVVGRPGLFRFFQLRAELTTQR
ncbi:trans-aconitate 2-methyltransferase [Antrihabitans sp. YC2-6]|uniref:class I SAM-dependent methyltransferase n=1 Tax=Antrihabitans sp. YC2-6 TaxID=2799498 RepID=UPI0018F73C41|nr:class I SAM-dependent methyltransferase [Antrihabitans sp. YC2-6]MBJ8343735.1 methyltransferase domain-containing protein [Antrihabitans sp. YC2-6]